MVYVICYNVNMSKKIKINFENVGIVKIPVKVIGVGFFRQCGSLRSKYYSWLRSRALVL